MSNFQISNFDGTCFVLGCYLYSQEASRKGVTPVSDYFINTASNIKVKTMASALAIKELVESIQHIAKTGFYSFINNQAAAKEQLVNVNISKNLANAYLSTAIGNLERLCDVAVWQGYKEFGNLTYREFARINHQANQKAFKFAKNSLLTPTGIIGETPPQFPNAANISARGYQIVILRAQELT